MYRVLSLVRQVKYNWLKFVKNERLVNNSFLALKDFKFLEVDTESEEEERQISHGHYSWFTRNTKREITIDFAVFASGEVNRFNKIKEIDGALQPPAFPTDTNEGYHELKFLDPNGQRWTCEAKVIDRIKISDYNNHNWAEFRVRLLVKDNSNIYGNSYTLTNTNKTQGVPLWQELSFPLDYYFDPSEISDYWIDYQGVSNSPLKSTITINEELGTVEYIMIRAITPTWSETLMIRNIALNTGDVIVVDWVNAILTKNWFDITLLAEDWYDSFLSVMKWEVDQNYSWNNAFLVDVGRSDSVLTAVWEWSDVWS